MKPSRWSRLAVALLAVGLLAVNRQWLESYQRATRLNRLVTDPEVPVTLAITTFALGPLRAVIVDALWWRAAQQQAVGEYFDALQLTDWITRLQPTYSSVWAYQAWNMAYNISSDFSAPQQRWQWILRGMALLRDNGLRYNPGDPIIRHELARIYYDRIGSTVDPHAEYYKTQWAFLAMRYFDNGTISELRQLAGAATTPSELLQRPGVRQYLEAAAAKGVQVLDFNTAPPLRRGLTVDMPEDLRSRAVWEVYYHYKRRRIEDDLKLDIDRMIFIDTQYGPLDWRLHQAHAIYWAAEDDFEHFMTQSVNYSLLVRQSMVSSFYEGRLFYDPRQNAITRTANLQILGRIHDYMAYLMDHRYSQSVMQAHQSFMQQAVAILYTYNREAEARELFEHYQESQPEAAKSSFEQFIVKALDASLSTSRAQGDSALIDAALAQSCGALQIGEHERANGFYNLAQLLWRRHQQRFADEPGKQLPAFPQMVKAATRRFADGEQIDEKTLNTLRTRARGISPSPVVLGGHREHHEDTSP